MNNDRGEWLSALLYGTRRWSLSPKRLVFIHVPKTAGIAVNDALCSSLDLKKRKSYIPFLSPRHEFVMLHDHLSPDDRAVALRRCDQARLIFGHFAIDTYETLARPDDFVFTFLRDPIERLHSVYRFWIQTADRLPYAINLEGMSFSEFLRYPAAAHRRHIDNTMTRLLGGAFMQGDLGREEWEDAFDRARRTLDALSFVGFTENYGADLSRLFEALQLNRPNNIKRVNVTTENARRQAETLYDAAARSSLTEQFTMYDRRLYDHARQLADVADRR